MLESDGVFDYEYDDEGNRTKRTHIASGDYVQYEWDYRNRLTGVRFKTAAHALTKQVEYEFDVQDRRTVKRADANGDATYETTFHYLYDEQDIVLVYDGSGALANRYLHGPAVDQIVADENAIGDVLWPLADNQGTVRDVAEHDALTDTTTIVKHLAYNAFGAITNDTAPTLTFLYAYTGREWDADAGLYYYRARWYDPQAGRFLSVDLIWDGTNRYAYVGNTPADFVDPTGLARTNLEWHHMLVQKQKWKEKFEALGFDINSAPFGWILDRRDHDAITSGWEREWDTFFKNNPNPTRDMVLQKLDGLKGDSRFAPYLQRGQQADLSYSAWNKLSPARKTQHFESLRKIRRLFGVLLAAGAASDAHTIFGPALALGGEAAQEDYRRAIIALENQRFDQLEAALFGRYAKDSGAVLLDENPEGLFPKLLARLAEANELSRRGTEAALAKAYKKFLDMVDGARVEAAADTCP